jgi:hypothetical protein
LKTYLELDDRPRLGAAIQCGGGLDADLATAVPAEAALELMEKLKVRQPPGEVANEHARIVGVPALGLFEACLGLQDRPEGRMVA